MTSHQAPLGVPGLDDTSPEPGSWPSDHQQAALYGNGAQGNISQSQYPSNAGYLRGFEGMQKKITRDGQPAKRRGPKPDSKPAQTRRQELNRQAQRTHRERKEQYIKGLEHEVARLREAFSQESVNVSNMLNHHEMLLRENQQEILILRDILTSRGVPFETELETRKANAGITGRDTSSLSLPHTMGHPLPFQNPLPPSVSTAGYSATQDQSMFSAESATSASGRSPTTTYHSHSPMSPDIQEVIKVESPEAVPDMPGIFERDPQLGVEFILALEATCRDHGEYLVRRSVASPNDPEKALFSGHALMASCPPPSHIENVTAEQGGLAPTYPHQVPQVSIEALNKLLNLSQKMKADGYVEGGQVTPIMALQSLRGHRNYSSVTRDDVVGMIESIRAKVRCYGFGAVMEDFELRDALRGIFATKPETYEAIGNADIEDMYT